MTLFDTHCHLDETYFPGGVKDVLARAKGVGVSRAMVVGVGKDLAPAHHAIRLSKEYPDMLCASVGVHPHDASTFAGVQSELRGLAEDPRVRAVGETGLDYHYDHSPRDVQRDVFRLHIAMAREIRKPIVVHTRNAAADTLSILEEEGARDVGGIIHCFSEDVPFARRALDLGFDLSFSGIVTFKSATSVHEAAKFAPMDRILVETDSPYLAPVPMRGKPCEPAYVLHTAKRLAELRGVTLDAVSMVTTESALRRLGGP